MKTAKITAALFVLVVLFIFSAYNYQSVEIVFLSYRSPSVPLFLVAISMFVLGAISTGLAAALHLSRLKRTNSILQREVDALQSANASGEAPLAARDVPTSGAHSPN